MTIPTAAPVYTAADANDYNLVRVVDLGDQVAFVFGTPDDGGAAPWQIRKDEAKNLFLALAQMVAGGGR